MLFALPLNACVDCRYPQTTFPFVSVFYHGPFLEPPAQCWLTRFFRSERYFHSQAYTPRMAAISRAMSRLAIAHLSFAVRHGFASTVRLSEYDVALPARHGVPIARTAASRHGSGDCAGSVPTPRIEGDLAFCVARNEGALLHRTEKSYPHPARPDRSWRRVDVHRGWRWRQRSRRTGTR